MEQLTFSADMFVDGEKKERPKIDVFCESFEDDAEFRIQININCDDVQRQLSITKGNCRMLIGFINAAIQNDSDIIQH
jgi:hypothetical protein